jgi:hypothetical protein
LSKATIPSHPRCLGSKLPLIFMTMMVPTISATRHAGRSGMNW